MTTEIVNNGYKLTELLESTPGWERMYCDRRRYKEIFHWYKFTYNSNSTFLKILTSEKKALLQIIYTPKQYRRNGIAKRALRSLQDLVDKLNDRKIAITLFLFPVPIHVENLPTPGKWNDVFETECRDEVLDELKPTDDIPCNTNDLIQFYKSMGFVRNDRWRKYLYDHQQISPKSYEQDRPLLMYPESHMGWVSFKWT